MLKSKCFVAFENFDFILLILLIVVLSLRNPIFPVYNLVSLFYHPVKVKVFRIDLVQQNRDRKKTLIFFIFFRT